MNIDLPEETVRCFAEAEIFAWRSKHFNIMIRACQAALSQPVQYLCDKCRDEVVSEPGWQESLKWEDT